MQPSRTHHAAPGAVPAPQAPATPTPTPDIVIPPPAGSTPPPADTMPVTQVPARPTPGAELGVPALSSTQIVVVTVLVLIWAGLLIFVRRLLTQSLVTQFADLGRARAAGTTLYLFLLVLGATLTVCAFGGYWQTLAVTVPGAVLNGVMLVLFLVSYGSARSSRQRR